MTSTEIAVPGTAAAPAERDIVDGWIVLASDVFKLAAHICETDFVPRAYRGNAPAAAAAILTGRELDLGPMMSLRHVQLVEGSPSLSAEYKRARVLSKGHDFAVMEWDDKHCKVRGRRRGSHDWLEVTYTMDDARRAGLVREKSGWVKRPRRMLFARAGTDLCDALFSDVVNGLPTAELLEDDRDDEAPEPDGNGQARPRGRVTAGEIISNETPAAGDDSSAPPARGGAAGAAPARDAQPPPPQDQAGNRTRTRTGPRAAGAASPRGAQPDPTRPAAPAATGTATGSSTAPAADAPSDPENQPGTAIQAQLNRMHAILTGLGFGNDDRDAKLRIAEVITGRTLTGPRDGRSSANLSYTEAERLIAKLDGFTDENGERDRAALVAFMAQHEAQHEAQGDDAL